jgi:DNA-binding NtrC family response regulator
MNHNRQNLPRREYDRDSNVLIVDDDSTLLKFFKIHLNKFFSKVTVVENGKEALEAMKEKDMDLILTDVRMPKIDGLELLTKIRKQHPDIPILLISGEPMSSHQQEIASIADGFLAKPFSVDELNDYICRGIDLRNAIKELMPALREPKKVREALAAKSAAFEKFIKRGHKSKATDSINKIRSLKQQAA